MAVHKPLHKHAFWLFGVIVGLAIKDALEATIPHLVDFSHIQEILTPQQLAKPQAYYSFYPDLFRLVIFLILIVRFYVGSAFYFGDVYGEEGEKVDVPHKLLTEVIAEVKKLTSDVHELIAGLPSFLKGSTAETRTTSRIDVEAAESRPPTTLVPCDTPEYSKTNYPLDFVSAFMHFLGFVLLALTIDVHTKPMFWFPLLIGFVLLYDFIWWAFSRPYDTKSIIFWWMLVNAITFGISLIFYGLAYYPFKRDAALAEMIAYLPVAAVSIYDIGSMMRGKPYFLGIKEALAHT